MPSGFQVRCIIIVLVHRSLFLNPLNIIYFHVKFVKTIVVKFLTTNVVTGIRRAVYAGREAFTQKGERQTRNYTPLVPVKN